MTEMTAPHRLIKRLRGLHGLTQAELAARLGVSRRTVNRWERASTQPHPAVVKAIKLLLETEHAA